LLRSAFAALLRRKDRQRMFGKCQATVRRRAGDVKASSQIKPHMSPETIAILVFIAAIAYGLGVFFEVQRMK
jgi:hypothetical protein